MDKDEQTEYKWFILKEYGVWIVSWVIILATYIILGIKLGIFSFVFLPYIIVGIVIGALILRTHIKVKTALILLNDFAQSIMLEIQKKE